MYCLHITVTLHEYKLITCICALWQYCVYFILCNISASDCVSNLRCIWIWSKSNDYLIHSSISTYSSTLSIFLRIHKHKLTRVCSHVPLYTHVHKRVYIHNTCIHIELFILQVLACFVQVTPASSLHSTSSSGKSIAEGINDLLSDNHWLTGTEVEAQHVRAMLQETAAQCRTPDTVCQTFVIQIHRHKCHAFTKYIYKWILHHT